MKVITALISRCGCFLTINHSKTFGRYISTERKVSQDLSNITKLIQTHTHVTRNNLTPEIALHLITPSSSLWHEPIEKVPFEDPFWAFYWPGGQAIARYILDNPTIVTGQSVLDIGSGCGACAIAAAMSNAHHVIANDIDKVAGSAILLNSCLNNVKITINLEQLIGSHKVDEDCLLIGDMFYDEIFADFLIKWLERIRTMEKNIYIGDPGRMSFIKYKAQFQCLAEYSLDHDYLSPGFSSVCVWKMK